MATRRRGNNEGSIRQRKDGRWEGRISLPNGQRSSFYGATRADVQAQIREAQRKLEDGIDLSAGKVSVKTFLERWLKASAKDSVKTRTYEGYESIVRVRVVPRLGSKHLAKVTPLD